MIKKEEIDLLNKSLVPVQYYMKWFDGNFSMWLHSHDYLEIMYVSSGSILVQFAKESNLENIETIKVSQGQFIFITPKSFHKMAMEKNGKAFVYNMEFTFEESSNEKIRLANRFMNINFHNLFNDTKLKKILINEEGYTLLNDIAQVGTSLKDLIIITEKNKSTDYLPIFTKEADFLIEVSDCITYKKMGEISYIRKTNSYILDNYQKKITIDEIANYVKISKYYLERQYKKQMGQTIAKFINLLRVQKARKLLLNGSLTVTQIATEVGFSNKNQLNYEFKKIIGTTPSEYRNNPTDTNIDFNNKNWKSLAVDPNTKEVF